MSEHNHAVNKEGTLDVNKVDDAIQRIPEEQREGILANFEVFQTYLRKRIALAEGIGLNEEQLALAAEKIAGYLAEHEEPRNREEKLLQELWRVGSDAERHQLAHMLVKLAQKLG